MERGVVTVLSVWLLTPMVTQVAQGAAVLQDTRDTRATSGFWGKLKIDCGVSIWGRWGPTNSKGYRTRTRTIVRHPQNGGARCPPLTETDFDPWFKSSVSYKASRVQAELVSGRTGEGTKSVYKRQAGTFKPRDFLFILDMSGSISSKEYTLQKDNLAILIGEICGTIGPAPTDNRAAVITYSTNPVMNFDFDDYLNLADLQAAVRNLPKNLVPLARERR